MHSFKYSVGMVLTQRNNGCSAAAISDAGVVAIYCRVLEYAREKASPSSEFNQSGMAAKLEKAQGPTTGPSAVTTCPIPHQFQVVEVPGLVDGYYWP